MAEVTQWIISDLTKEKRTELLTLVDTWKASSELWMPRFGEVVAQGRKVIIHFPISNSRKIRQLLAQNGFPTVSAR